MPGDVIKPINWELLQQLNTADLGTKHFVGTMRCMECRYEFKAVVPAPLWAMHPPSAICESEKDCEGLMVFVHPDTPPLDGVAESYDYTVVLPADRNR